MLERDELAELSGSLPHGRVTDDRNVLSSFEVPERGVRGSAAFLAEPADVSELSTIASWAYANRRRLVVQGANTGLVEASTPDFTGEQGILGLGRMSRLIDFDPSDRIAVVEAGIRLGDLNAALADANQMFPIELGSNPTVGGLIATNAGGARTIRYGDAGSRVVGLEAVLADDKGSTVGAPSRLIKDNSRLKIDRVFVGSFGALGVISRLAVRTEKRPTSVATALISPDSHHDVLTILTEFERDFDHDLSAFEFISGETIALARSTTPGFRSPLGLDREALVLIEVVSRTADRRVLEESVAVKLEKISKAYPRSVVEAVITPPGDAWAMRHTLSEGVVRAGATLRFDVSVPRMRLPELRDFVLARFRSSSVSVSEFGHWGDGGTHLALVYPDRDIPEPSHVIRQEIYDKVVFELGGSFSSEHGLGRHNAAFYERYISEAERAMASRLKHLLDPRSVWGSAPFA